jgi:ATPase subunit of ABC transporter with duplicated ATPase domains
MKGHCRLFAHSTQVNHQLPLPANTFTLPTYATATPRCYCCCGLQIQEGRCVSMRGLRKVYDNGKVAVEGLDLDLFEGQISVLLGQNGAGTYTYFCVYIYMLRAS